VKLSDIIELSDVRLVIELDDADRDPDGISRSFVLTDEVEKGLKGILDRIETQKGCGVFLKGNFGSGKSHFLSFLYLLLKNRSHPILDDYEGVRSRVFHLIKVSLVRYPSSLSLEGILLQCLDYKGNVSDREDLFKGLLRMPAVIIIDELSEFLRSKPTPARFYEDIRFLQFLGEFSSRHPLWVIASLQEWIEETGHISSSIFNRIKDRYPLRINLSSSHIEDIIDQRLVIKKDGSSEVIRGVFDELKRFYPNLELRLDRFRKTYPLHPFTTRFLSGLTRVFSQHRGVIQFVQSEVRKRLNDPPDSLITPEAIFDHFEDRLREIPEFSSLARIAYDYYRNNLSSLFNNPTQQEIAKAVIKILILTEVSPLEKRKTAKDIAEILLKKISILTDKVNYDYIKNGILEPLVAHQMYIMKEGETYFIDISQDEGIRIKARVKALRERFSDRNYLSEEIAALISLPYLPLREIRDGRRYRFNWQNSQRECIVLFSSEVSQDDIERFVDGVRKRVDGYLAILSPFSNFIPRPSNPGLSSIQFWQPRKLTEEETIIIEEYIAKNMLLNDFPSLKEEVKRTEPLFRDIITKAYFEGAIISSTGTVSSINNIGYLPIERLLSHLFDSPMRDLYPDHQKIMPRIDIYSSHHINSIFHHLIKQGKTTIEEAEKNGLTPTIRGILEPLGLVTKRGNSFTLNIAPENELISYILDLIRQEDNLYKIRMNLRKSRWGLVDDQIDLLLSSLIVSGYAIPFNRQGTCDFRDIGQLSSGDIITIRPGRALEPDLVSAIPRGRFIWGDIETSPTPSTLKIMWKEAGQFIRRYRKLIEEIQSMMNRYRDYSIFKGLRIDTPVLNRMALFVNSVGLNMSPQEGIERFLLFLKENENLEEQVSYIERLYRFFDEEFQLLNKYYLYLTHPALKGASIGEPSPSSLLSMIQKFLSELSDFEDIRKGWTEFYDSYTSFYKDRHDRYYESPVFGLKRQIEDSQAMKTLKRIAHIVSSITFENEWWELKKKVEEIPDSCNADLNQELFLNPVCRCGFRSGMEPPVFDTDIPSLCEDGIKNFIKTIQSSENMEKIDSTITGLNLSGKRELSQRLLRIMNINPDRTGINTIIPLLDDEVLQEIENAFKGRWKIKEVQLQDLVDRIKGRRFRYEELKRLFLNWIGEDTESIIHVRTRDSGEEDLREDLAMYGIEGKKAYMELIDKGFSPDHEDIIDLFQRINLRDFETNQLIDLLKNERNAYMKKRLRNEIFERLWNSGIGSPGLESMEFDEGMGRISKAIYLLKRASGVKGIHVFKDFISPLSLITAWLSYENINENILDRELMVRLILAFDSLLKEYEKRPDRYEGVRDIAYIKERLSGNVIIMDGLRYDLYLLLREIMINEGWKIRDEVFKADSPTTTSNFREILGISEEKGIIDGKSYSLIRVAEREIGKRNLRKILKEGYDINFFHFNFIDTRVHGSTIDLNPLYEIIKKEFHSGIVPILKELSPFYLLSDHGFTETGEIKERYRHGGKSLWEMLLPFAEIKL